MNGCQISLLLTAFKVSTTMSKQRPCQGQSEPRRTAMKAALGTTLLGLGLCLGLGDLPKCRDVTTEVRLCRLVDRYDSQQRPQGQTERPLVINTTLDLIDIRTVDENNFFISLALLFTLSWIDDRLG